LISRSTIVSRNGWGSSATRRRIVSASRWCNISASGDACSSCQRGAGSFCIIRCVIHCERGAGSTREFATADIAQDREEPRLDLCSAKRVEIAQRAQIAFLHGIIGIRRVVEKGNRASV